MTIPHFTVIYDANILYGAFQRDVFMHLALTDLYRARWSEHIHEEWMRNVVAAKPDMSTSVHVIRAKMDDAVEDCLVKGYEGFIDSISLPDLNDRHVVAAAIRAQAEIIVTANGKDFPAAALEPYGIEAQHPDLFFCDLVALDPEKVLSKLESHRAGKSRPALTPEDYCRKLERCAMRNSAALLRKLWGC